MEDVTFSELMQGARIRAARMEDTKTGVKMTFELTDTFIGILTIEAPKLLVRFGPYPKKGKG